MSKTVFYIPRDAYVEDAGWRVSFVVEGEAGHRPSGNWPYSGARGETRPYFYGHDYDAALEACYLQNEKMGISREETDRIVRESVLASARER